MKQTLFFLLLSVVSCSHVETNKVVSFPFAPELLVEAQKVGRVPASLEVKDVEGKSPRRVYFSALYYQYLMMGQHLGEPGQIAYCPQFHHDKVETDERNVPQISIYRPAALETSEHKYFPETAFNADFTLKDHYVSVEEEIKVLCEEGVSDNYFKFDNLITHYAGSRVFHTRPESMQAVLKIPVFANYYLLKMSQTPNLNLALHAEEKSVIELTQTFWFEKYVAEAQRLRNNFIKHKMVQR